MRIRIAVVGLLVSTAVMAETAYVSDRLSAPLRWAQGEAAPVVKQLESGTPVDVLERTGGFVRVKDKQGAEGWLEARQVSAEAPARAQLARAAEETRQLRNQLASSEAELKKVRAALAAEGAKVKSLEAAAATPAPPPPITAAAPTASMAPAADGPASAGNGGKTWPWVLGGFAMLGIGFVAGFLWLRESIKRRSGGMYIKV